MSRGNHDFKDIIKFKTREDVPFEQAGEMNVACIDLVKGKSGSNFENKTFVRKRIPISEFENRKLALEAFTNEIKALRAAQHFHVVELITEYFLEDVDFVIIMERAEEDMSKQLMTEVDADKMKHFATWFTCLARAIDYLHGLGIRHRDIKPENILIKNGRVLIADFGISAIGLKMTMSTTIQGRVSSKTEKYAAPEVLEGGSRDQQADIFSLGAVFLEMIHAYSHWYYRPALTVALKANPPAFGRKVWEIQNHISLLLDTEERDWSELVLELCQRMLDEDPFKRPTALEVLEGLEQLDVHECQCNNDGDRSIRELLVESCRKNDPSMVKKCLDDGADAGARGVIHQAASHKGSDLVALLLDSVKPKDKKELVNQKNYGGQTPLHSAVGYGDLNTVKYLVKAGINITASDDDADTALHCAAAYGKQEILEYLLETFRNQSSANMKDSIKAYLDQKDRSGRTALLCAVRRGHLEAAQVLLRAGATADLADAKQRTPLHLAAGYGCMQTVDLLLGQNLSAHATDSNGNMPLFYAAGGRRQGGDYEQIVKKFLDLGVPVRVEDITATAGMVDPDGRAELMNSAYRKYVQPRKPSRFTKIDFNLPKGLFYLERYLQALRVRKPQPRRGASELSSNGSQRDRSLRPSRKRNPISSKK